MEAIISKTVNEFFRQFVDATNSEQRISIKNYAQTHLNLEDSIRFLDRCISWLLNR
jgi:hypothetical protein